jgi:hypothetical protein
MGEGIVKDNFAKRKKVVIFVAEKKFLRYGHLLES